MKPGPVSPLSPLLGGLALALALAALLLRTLTTGAGLELHSPGTQLLLDGVALTAATFLALARLLRGEPALGAGPLLLGVLGAWVLALVASAWGAPHADLAWRTALSAVSLVLLGLTCGDLSRDPRLRPLVLGAILACVTVAAGLGLWWYAVEQPRLRAAFDQEQSELGQQLSLFDASFRQGLRERAHDRVAAGPFVIGNLLACACATLLPLVLVTCWGARTRPVRLAAGLVGAAILFLGLALSGSKGGALAGAAALGVFVALHPRLLAYRRRLILAGLGLGLFAGLGLLAIYLADPEARGVGMSLSVRLEYWQAALGMWGDAPLLGQGPNHYREFVSAYKSARAEEALHAHNAELQLLAETGLLGLGATLALAVVWLRPAWGQLKAASAEGEPPPPLIPPAQVLWWALLGFVLGALLLTGYGDYVSGAPDTQGQLAAVLVSLPAACAAYALLLPAAPARLLPAAGWAGLGAFLTSTQLDFSLQHAGTAAVALALAGCLPALGDAPPAVRQPRGVTLAVCNLLALLTVGIVLGVVPLALSADALRNEARELHLGGALAARSETVSERAEAVTLLRQAANAFEDSLESYPWSSFTWRERAATLEGLGREDDALDCYREALVHNPRAHAAWHDQALLLDRLGRHQEAFAAHQQALALYPHHPAMLLAAADSRLASRRKTPPGPERDALSAEAADLLQRALEASETTRLVLRKLQPEDEARARQLLAGLRPQ